MSENGAPKEECLYCHNNLVDADHRCLVCDAKKDHAAQTEKRRKVFFMQKTDPYFIASYP